MASGSITSWQTEGGKVRAVTDFLFLGSKTTADSDCSHEIRRCLLLRRKAVKNLNSVLKSKDITSPTNVHIVKAMVFSLVKYGCDSWTIKKAEHQRIDTFEFWCWRWLLTVPWTARKSNQFTGRTDAEAGGPILWHLMWRTDSLERPWFWKRLSTGGEESDKGWNGWMAPLSQWTWTWVNSRR